ncbi:hypothetical protein RFI_39572 [Reticulomyxa filosa]|uniref:Uncharacterized protein n=1 Tax=Reticulomyxa filosa TaxID=46433 RepID=X6LA07_RETFI|nr:hypothetical protein RFI_39572 [Reticulomyxa filosa]|eukprot:ETN97951.1 hypothetical protein RFI_39572 [Reticulomyxa filosa]
MKVEKDEDIERVFKSEFVHFNARIKQKKYITRNDQLNIQRNHIMMNPLVLLAEAIRYETSGKKLTTLEYDSLILFSVVMEMIKQVLS